MLTDKFREFRVLALGPIPQGQNAELDFAEKKFREFRGFRVMDLAQLLLQVSTSKPVFGHGGGVIWS